VVAEEELLVANFGGNSVTEVPLALLPVSPLQRQAAVASKDAHCQVLGDHQYR
jgi:hypothetical protein